MGAGSRSLPTSVVSPPPYRSAPLDHARALTRATRSRSATWRHSGALWPAGLPLAPARMRAPVLNDSHRTPAGEGCSRWRVAATRELGCCCGEAGTRYPAHPNTARQPASLIAKTPQKVCRRTGIAFDSRDDTPGEPRHWSARVTEACASRTRRLPVPFTRHVSIDVPHRERPHTCSSRCSSSSRLSSRRRVRQGSTNRRRR
jgi:hypothetical protein